MGLGRVNPHDGDETFCMTVLALKSCHRANAVSSLHGQVSRAMWSAALSRTQRGSRADRPHHQRRPRADLAGAADAAGLRPPSRAGLDRARERRRALGPDRRHRRRRAVGDAPDAEGAAHRDRAPPHRAAGRAARRARRARRPAPPRAELRRADDRLRAPLRHLQARRPDAARHRSVRRARQQPDDADSVRLRRQVAPARRPGQGDAAARSRSSRATRASPASSSSSRTTTSTSAGTSSRASTCGSTTRGGRSRRAARAARRSCSTAA